MGGSTLQAAIDLAVTAVAEIEPSDNNGMVVLSSGWPVGVERTFRIADAADRRDDELDFPAAALACASSEFGHFAGKIALTSTLPIAAGLASSAACLIATIAAVAGELGHLLTKEALCELAFRAEIERLRTGAGEMDFWSCGLGGTRLTHFENEKQVSVLDFPNVRAVIVVGDSGVRAATAHSIAKKRERFRLRDVSIMEYQRQTAELVCEMADALAKNEELFAVAQDVTACHHAIAGLMGSSTRQIDEMVDASLHAGAAGAKLTGGGEGGCMFAITARDAQRDDIVAALPALGGVAYPTSISTIGVVTSQDS